MLEPYAEKYEEEDDPSWDMVAESWLLPVEGRLGAPDLGVER